MAIAILDDLFPWRGSGFRYTEYDYYLSHSNSIRVFSTLASLGFVNEFHNRQQIMASSDYGDKLQFVEDFDNIPRMDGYYCLFLNNTPQIIELAERDNVPFLFTLYPGGGFEIGNEEVYERLRKIIEHPLLGRIIATQPETLKILNELGCKSSQIEYIFGVVSEIDHQIKPIRKRLGHKRVKNVAFAAHKYNDLGIDKGLDLFIKLGDLYISKKSGINFHIVGPWKDALTALSEHPEEYVIHEIIPIEKLSKFFSGMDIAVFPTRRDVNAPGRFDGFPTATMVQAGLAGCVAISTNPLYQDTPLQAGKDFLQIEPQFDSLVNAVDLLVQRDSTVQNISEDSRRNFHSVFSLERQMHRRLSLLEEMASPTGA